eukprot:6184378-Pleurochrysis_carterae.AAC.5
MSSASQAFRLFEKLYMATRGEPARPLLELGPLDEDVDMARERAIQSSTMAVLSEGRSGKRSLAQGLQRIMTCVTRGRSDAACRPLASKPQARTR